MRPTRIHIDNAALKHNLVRIKSLAPDKKVIAMVKANAYGCGLVNTVQTLAGLVDGFGVACLEEALAVRELSTDVDCILFQGVFSADEVLIAEKYNLQIAIHQPYQLQWILQQPLKNKLTIWVKINTGMNRLGFSPKEAPAIIDALSSCPWVNPSIQLMTHFACADEPDNAYNLEQLAVFSQISSSYNHLKQSLANSAAILAMPAAHADIIRPGIMLYGVSPFSNQVGADHGLQPVMQLVSAISALQTYPANSSIGYGGTWKTKQSTCIGIVPVGYGDGYPRHIRENTPVWIKGKKVPIVGRVSMDMLTVDLSACPGVNIGDPVELWGKHIPVETVAASAGTIGYELLCQATPRIGTQIFFNTHAY